ncbi:hypothetical protein POX_c04538 [Penicillium oxalicum]|nr:hypothetical protein POX_c04538 [Penicillium oxalicum]KAI2791671.1 hypothetical protein POX_c04538 [Penicillium oxalicum]
MKPVMLRQPVRNFAGSTAAFRRTLFSALQSDPPRYPTETQVFNL